MMAGAGHDGPLSGAFCQSMFCWCPLDLGGRDQPGFAKFVSSSSSTGTGRGWYDFDP